MINASDLTPSSYNPRSFSEKHLKGLKKSMQEFADISGITWNKQTKNIVTGHHRWSHLCDIYGIDKLKFEAIKGTDRSRILSGKKDTGYILRVVDWDINKEKAANVLANSHAVEGNFTADLQPLLADIKLSMDEIVFEDLNLDELFIAEAKSVEEEVEDKKEKKKKSETVISGGGETYKTIKLELSPLLSERLRVQLERFKLDLTSSVEQPLEIILSYLESKLDEDILSSYKKKSDSKKRRK